MKLISEVKSRNQLLSNIAVHFLSGLIIALLASLLIYFKQKETFHHTVILISVFAIQFTCSAILKRLDDFQDFFKAASLILLLIVCFLGPQFIYQIRPYTFYISGFVVGSIWIVAISSSLLAHDPPNKFPWNSIFFLIGYLTGYLLPAGVLQYSTIAISMIIATYFLVTFPIKPILKATVSISLIALILVFWRFSAPMVFHEVQSDYEDKVIFTAETQFHELVVTQWHQDYWFFIDKLKNLSSIDEYLYYEPMAHSVLKVADQKEEVLVIGGENGCLIREVLKNDGINNIDVISYDTLLRNLGIENQYFLNMNQAAYSSEKIHIIHENVLRYISNPTKKYDVIFMDLPDPKSTETNQYYTIEFYNLIEKFLNENGIMITQAGSPYFATQAFYAIGQTIQAAGFHVLPIHNQILTLGEWGWYICSMGQGPAKLKKRLVQQKEFSFETKWFNDEAASLISSFGKTYNDTLNVQINSLENPLVYKYYLKGNWNLN
jgi:predicted membrane-bound spermidine synthase